MQQAYPSLSFGALRISLPQQGYPLCGHSDDNPRTPSLGVSIPQQGYPLCGFDQSSLKKAREEAFQYRSRVIPPLRLGPEWVGKGPACAFQYRSRVTPFAACRCDTLSEKTLKFQYRSRVTPFAAFNSTAPAKISRCFNTTAGLPPLRLHVCLHNSPP